MIWHDSPYDEHPVADVSLGQDKIWQAVDAIATARLWPRTVFLLTWDDWGGWDDHVVTPSLEFTPDGVQLAYGPRVPLLMFGGPVKAGIDSRWNSHVSIGKTVLDLLGLPPLGVPRLDDAPSLANLVDPSLSNPPPPAFGSTITQPPPPVPTPDPRPTRRHRQAVRCRSGRCCCATAAPCHPQTTSRFIPSQRAARTQRRGRSGTAQRTQGACGCPEAPAGASPPLTAVRRQPSGPGRRRRRDGSERRSGSLRLQAERAALTQEPSRSDRRRLRPLTRAWSQDSRGRRSLHPNRTRVAVPEKHSRWLN